MGKIVKTGPGPEFYGKYGSLVFVRGRYGLYVRENVKPTNPQTAEQMEVRSRMSRLARMWGELEFWQMAEWEEAVHWHDIKSKDKKGKLTGRAFFMRTNLNLLKIGCEPMATCPIELSEAMMLENVKVEVIVKAMHEDMLLTFEPDLDEYNFIVVSATPVLRCFHMPNDNHFRKIGVIDKSWNHGKTPSSIMNMYLKRFGVRVGVKERVAFKFQVIENQSGQTGNPFYLMTEGHM